MGNWEATKELYEVLKAYGLPVRDGPTGIGYHVQAGANGEFLWRGQPLPWQVHRDGAKLVWYPEGKQTLEQATQTMVSWFERLRELLPLMNYPTLFIVGHGRNSEPAVWVHPDTILGWAEALESSKVSTPKTSTPIVPVPTSDANGSAGATPDTPYVQLRDDSTGGKPETQVGNWTNDLGQSLGHLSNETADDDVDGDDDSARLLSGYVSFLEGSLENLWGNVDHCMRTWDASQSMKYVPRVTQLERDFRDIRAQWIAIQQKKGSYQELLEGQG